MKSRPRRKRAEVMLCLGERGSRRRDRRRLTARGHKNVVQQNRAAQLRLGGEWVDVAEIKAQTRGGTSAARGHTRRR